MFTSAVIVFREVFEIVLIVGIILAATKTMPGRAKAVALGFGGGVLGSALLAVFTGEISEMAQGLGQEYFNACILFTAAGFIGWTVLWMKKNARTMKKHFEELGLAVTQGRAPYITLSAIIALTILREGSEIVLFTYSQLAGGQQPFALLIGSTLGMLGGLAVGIGLYMGLIRLSVKIFMQTTSFLLVLLVAGMVSQGFGWLIAAGAFTDLTQVVWDSSAIVNDHGLLGKSLAAMMGYTARPTEIQLIVYIACLVSMLGMMKMIDKNISFNRFFRA